MINSFQVFIFCEYCQALEKDNDIYFLWLDPKKVTKKDQGKPERSARFATSRTDLRFDECVKLNFQLGKVKLVAVDA